MDASTPGPFSLLLRRPAATLAVWVLPALAVALLTVFGGPAAPDLAAPQPDPAAAALQLARLVGQLVPELFVVVLAAAPTARLAEGEPLRAALGTLRRPAPWGVAALCAALLGGALLAPMLPGLLALYVNPLMGLIFLTAGTIGGAALAVGLFGRWMLAPALAAEGAGALAALARSKALARRGFGAALGLAALFALALVLGTAAGALAARALPGALPAARAAATALALAPLLPAVPTAAAHRLRAARATPGATPGPAPAPSLALRWRPTRCPACGATAQAAPAEGERPAPVACPRCGLRGQLR